MCRHRVFSYNTNDIYGPFEICTGYRQTFHMWHVSDIRHDSILSAVLLTNYIPATCALAWTYLMHFCTLHTRLYASLQRILYWSGRILMAVMCPSPWRIEGTGFQGLWSIAQESSPGFWLSKQMWGMQNETLVLVIIFVVCKSAKP